jgi:Zn-dependent protease with chaperone function
MSSAWLAWRALLAVALMLGYFVLAITMCGGLLYFGYSLSLSTDIFHRCLFVLCTALGAIILVATPPGWDRFVAPGPRLEPQEQPRLFERVNKVALLLGQQMPKEIYLTEKVNAWVTQRGGIMGFGSRRVMVIGLPLFQLLTVSQFEAVLAHEFGHFHASDTRLGPWLYKTRAGIERTIMMMSLAQGPSRSKFLLFQLPFVWYGNFFMRVTQAISRIQELAADRLAANTIGAQAFAQGLRVVYRNRDAFGDYVHNEVIPAVRHGYQPPLIEGFTLYLQSEQISNELNQFVEKEFAEVRNDPHDSHPPLPQRLAALEHLPAGKAADHSPALSLLNNVPEVETRMFSQQVPRGAEGLKPISWQETGQRVIIPGWEQLCRKNERPLREVTLNSLVSTAATLNNFAEKTEVWALGAPVDVARDYAERLLAAAIGFALYREGWQIDNGPGYLWMRRSDTRINPRQLIKEMRTPEFTEDKWQEMLKQFELDPAISLAPTSLSGSVQTGRA